MNANIHNEANFKPEEYEVLEYLDNQPPRLDSFLGINLQAGLAMYNLAREQWQAKINQYFPGWDEGKVNIHKCKHCGNGTVRYIAAVKYVPTGEVVVFGDVCIYKLEFKNRDEYKAAMVRQKAAQMRASAALYVKRNKFLAQIPALKQLIEDTEEMNHPCHKDNEFVKDIISKLNTYGGLSDGQVQAFIASIAKDHERHDRAIAEAANPPAELAPQGRVEITGEVIHTRTLENGYGISHKMLVKLENRCKVWMTIPGSSVGAVEKGMKISVTATFNRAQNDQYFSYGSRPSNLQILPQEVAIAQ